MINKGFTAGQVYILANTHSKGDMGNGLEDGLEGCEAQGQETESGRKGCASSDNGMKRQTWELEPGMENQGQHA